MAESVIYSIKHLASGKQYIGSSSDWKRRQSEHRSELRGSRHCNPHLQRSWDKYGEASFEFLVLERTEPDALLDRETYWIDKSELVFNICSPIHSRLGIPHTPDHCAKISAAKLGHAHSEITKARIREKRALQVITPESTAKTQAKNLGKKRAPEFGARISQALSGRALSAAHRANLAAANLGKKDSAETRAKKSAALKASWVSRKLITSGNALELNGPNT